MRSVAPETSAARLATHIGSPADPAAVTPRDPLARRSRLAGLGVVVILLGVSLFAVWASQATARAAVVAAAASRLSDDYGRAASAVAAEESLERKYRLEPGLEVRVRYDAAAANLLDALRQVEAHGGATDRALVDQIRVRHASYLAAIHRLFAAVDRGDTDASLRIDAEEVDPSFAVIEQVVLDQAAAQHSVALRQLRDLRRVESLTSRLTPVVFLLGLLLVALLGLANRGYRRMLVAERTRAVHDSLHDALTGLPNRALLADRFDGALRVAASAGSTTALLLIDLDRFKEVNDTFGHHYGDELLAQVGPRLRAALRDSDTVARLGGDEFAVLLPDVDGSAAAILVAEKLRRVLEAPFHVEGIDLDVEASIGVVLSGQHGEDATTLLQRADIAMYVAKAKNLGVFAYDPDVDGHSPARLALLGELRRALERDELILHYQPKVNVTSGAVVGAEALVRWQHPTRGLVFPDAFIPVAEHTGLIGPLTCYVLDTAVAQARTWADAGRPLQVSVNLSARNLLDDRLPDEVAAVLTRHGVPAAMLELEVTETAIMTEPVRARRLLERLAKLGVRISVDDFGAGYTSLGQLKTLPVSELKIDRSFVMTMMADRSDALIVHSIVDLGHNLGLTIVAEGVETDEALTLLAGFGCDIAQGYQVCRPAAIETFDTWRRDRPTAAIPRPNLVS
jgi:diguanylate cyclase (GGDEF)-like protein